CGAPLNPQDHDAETEDVANSKPGLSPQSGATRVITNLPEFTEEETVLLVFGKDRDDFFVHDANEIGKWVSSGRYHFLDDSNRTVRVFYLEALESLRNRRLVKFEGGQ